MEESMSLWPETLPESYVEDGFRPYLDLFPLEKGGAKGSVLVLPGGGDNMRADHEAEPIARAYNANGYHAFVAHYRVAPHTMLAAFMDVIRAIRLVRSLEHSLALELGRLAVCGFSAGGHLAALLGVHRETGDPVERDPIDAYSRRPDALILAYPWITNKDQPPHEGKFPGREGEKLSYISQTSAEEHVTPDTPPSFLWHTANDEIVPVEHSILFAEKLRQNKVQFELHVYDRGRHGLGLSEDDTHVKTWLGLSCEWMDRQE